MKKIIINDEEIKEGDWCYNTNKNRIFKHDDLFLVTSNDNVYIKKIILTTDQDLIKEGVQAIDDEVLEWFVKNPSCEFVNIVPFDGYNPIDGDYSVYELIIPKEEPKQDKIMERFIANAKKQYNWIDIFKCVEINLKL